LTGEDRLVSVGRVGKPHGLDGSFYVDAASHPLPEGMTVIVRDQPGRVERRAGTDERPLVRLEGVNDRDAADAIRGEPLLAALEDAPLEEGEWLAEDLVGCEVPGLGEVTRVVAAPSCDLLEVGPNAVLVPLVADAVRAIDVEARRIDVDLEFLSLGDRSEDS
jgi:16S rRNA processing protein RimM